MKITRVVKFIRKGDKGDPGDHGAKGEVGPTLRAPQFWSDLPDGYHFYAGGEGEKYLDVVLYNDQFWECKLSHTKSSSNAPSAGSTYWKLGEKVELIAANVLLANHAQIANFKFENGVLQSLFTKNGQPTVILDGQTGRIVALESGQIGWLKIEEGGNLKGYEKVGTSEVLRLLIKSGSLDTVDSLITNQNLNVSGYSNNYCDMYSDYLTEQHVTQYTYNCSFGFTPQTDSSNVDVAFNVTARAYVRAPGGMESEDIQADIRITSSSFPTMKEHWGSVRLNCSVGQLKTISMAVRATSSSAKELVRVKVEIRNLHMIVSPQRTIIAKDGLLSIWNGNYLDFRVNNGFNVSMGLSRFRMTSTNGIQISEDGGTTWKKIKTE